MIKATVILGQEAVEQYHETNEIPSDKWLKGHSGEVNAIEFRTQGEYDAYEQALSDGQGWEESLIIKSDGVPRDCPFCQKWRVFFVDKKTTVYCPDCGQPILNPGICSNSEEGTNH